MSNAHNTSSLPDIARRIKLARVKLHLSQSGLASQIGVSDKSISAYEQGRSTPPFEKLKRIAAVTNHPLGYFTDDNNESGVIASKLASIEKELMEVKKLLSRKTGISEE